MLDARTLLFSTLLFAVTRGRNDWATPCLSGTCSYDTGDGLTTAFSSLILNGAATAISDITPAAGWQIAGCSPTWSSGTQNVKITCAGTSTQTANCPHVLQGGAAGKIVRLPEHCGTGPFARVAAATTTKRTRRAHDAAHALTLDYDFEKIPASMGKVSFSVTSSNVQNNTLSRRNLLHRGRAKLLRPRFSKNETVNAPPIAVSKDIPLLDTAIGGCTGASGSLKVDVEVDLNAQLAFGVTVAGTIVPPALTQLALTATMSGDASADFTVAASVLGAFDTGAVALFSLGLPGLSFPGILELGPQFSIAGQLTANLGAQAQLTAGAKWTFPDVTLIFPPGQGQSTASATPATDTPLELSIGSAASASGSLAGHIIPKIDLGINVLGGIAQASIFLDMDISSTLGLQLNASASSSAAVSAGGCATLDAGIDISAGATGAIKPIFDKNVNFDIFSKSVNILTKCFGDAGATNVTTTSTDSASSTSTDSSSTDTDASTTADTDASTTTDTDASSTATDAITAADTATDATNATDTSSLAAPTDSAADTSIDPATDTDAGASATDSSDLAPPPLTSLPFATDAASPTASDDSAAVIVTADSPDATGSADAESRDDSSTDSTDNSADDGSGDAGAGIEDDGADDTSASTDDFGGGSNDDGSDDTFEKGDSSGDGGDSFEDGGDSFGDGGDSFDDGSDGSDDGSGDFKRQLTRSKRELQCPDASDTGALTQVI